MTPRAAAALAALEEQLETAWREAAAAHPGLGTEDLARSIAGAPNDHAWRLVDAALDRLRCDACGTALGSGRRGCDACGLADGLRFAAREPDRPGVPPGNEHAIRVATAMLRSPARYPGELVAGTQIYLPLFVEGQLPTRAENQALAAAWRAGVRVPVERLAAARTFAELLAIVRGAATD